MSGPLSPLGGFLARLGHRVLATARTAGPPETRPCQAGGARQARRASGRAYPGDFTGPLTPTYEPRDDDRADPGEVVWAWVPYEDDPTQGKDRPALVVARDGDWLLALPVTSRDHDRDAAQEEAAGRYWVDIGSGAWDARRRPSEARVNRIVRLVPESVRRIGARLDRARFAEVCAAMAAHRP